MQKAATMRRSKPCRTSTTTLCETRVLDPACGTGNFLYVSLELMKRLEGEVLEALPILADRSAAGAFEPYGRPASVPWAGDQSARRGDRGAGAVDRLSAMAFPHQGAAPSEPILRAFHEYPVHGCGADMGWLSTAACCGRQGDLSRIHAARTGQRRSTLLATHRLSAARTFAPAWAAPTPKPYGKPIST